MKQCKWKAMQSLNFCPHDTNFRGFLEQSLLCMRQEVPWAHDAMLEQLDGFAVTIVVDTEQVMITGTRERLVLAQASGAVDVELRTSAATIVALATGMDTLERAILEDRIFLRGSASHLLRFYDGLLLYLHGAVRGPSFPYLLARFQTDFKAVTPLYKAVTKG